MISREIYEKICDEPFENIMNILDCEIKFDYSIKISVLLAGVSAYTDQPLNLYITGPTSTGKSYVVTRVLDIFPQNDVWFLGKISPTAIVHQKGEQYSASGRKISEVLYEYRAAKAKFKQTKNLAEFQAEREKLMNELIDSYYLIDLKNKILVFLETPHPETLRMLYPILSHDKREIHYRITDKNKAGQLETKHVIIKNWPAAIFLRAKEDLNEEMASRCLILTPELSEEKYAAANELTLNLNMRPWIQDEINNVKNNIQFFFINLKTHAEKIQSVIIPFSDIDKFYPSEIGRDMRDFTHYLQLIKCLGMLNFKMRVMLERNGKQYLLANEEDVKKASILWLTLFETTRYGVPQHILDFYHKVLGERDEWLLSDAVAAYNSVFKPKRSRNCVRRYLKILEEIGYVVSEEDAADKRRFIFKPVQKEKCAINANFDFKQILDSNLKENFEKWLKNIYTHTQLLYNNINGEGEEELHFKVYKDSEGWVEIDPSTLKNNILLYSEGGCVQIFSGVFSILSTKIGLKINAKQDFEQIAHNSEENKPENKPSQIKSIIRIKTLLLQSDKCWLCGKTGVEWQAETFSGEKHPICQECFKKWVGEKDGN